jgi:uncharacterized low-complexity protein
MSKKTLTTVMGAALATSFAGLADAAENPFAMKDLARGYMQVAEADKAQGEMKCGEGMCGGQMTKSPEMNCGAMKQNAQEQEAQQKKAMEGKCAGMKMDAPAPAGEQKAQ